MTFVIDTEAVAVLASRMDRAADDAGFLSTDVRAAVAIGELASDAPVRLDAVADDYVVAAGILRLRISAIESEVITAQQVAEATGVDVATAEARLALLAELGITAPDEVLATLIRLGSADELTSVRQITIGLPPSGQDPELDARIERLDAAVLPAIVAGQALTIGSADQRADLEFLATILAGGQRTLPVRSADGTVVDVPIGQLSDAELTDAVGAGLGFNRLARQLETDAIAMDASSGGATASASGDGTGSDASDQVGLSDDLETSQLDDDQLSSRFNNTAGRVDDLRSAADRDAALANALDIISVPVKNPVIGIAVSVVTTSLRNQAALADAEAVALENELADLGLEAAKREGINIDNGRANRIDGEGNFIQGDENEIEGDGNAVIGDNNQVFGDDNRVFGGGNGTVGDGNTVRGDGNLTVGDDNHINGDNNRRTDGNGNVIDGDGNRTEGDDNSVRGDDNKIDGNGNVVGDDDDEGGENNDITGNDNQVTGDDNTINGNNNISIGDNNTINGNNSIAVGDGTVVDGDRKGGTSFGEFDLDTGDFDDGLDFDNDDNDSGEDDNDSGDDGDGGGDDDDTNTGTGTVDDGTAQGGNTNTVDDGDDDSGDDGDDDRVICTYFYRRGELSRSDWVADMKFTRDNISERTVRGYHAWAVPTVQLMRSDSRVGRIVTPVMRFVAVHRARELAHRMGRAERGDLLGKLFRLTLEPLCWVIGGLVGPQDWERLYVDSGDPTVADAGTSPSGRPVASRSVGPTARP